MRIKHLNETYRKKQKFSNRIGFIICIALTGIVIGGVNAEDGCKRACTRSSDTGKLKYPPGSAYHYNFESVATIGIENAETEETGLKLKGNAILYSEGNCAYTLKLENVEVQTTLEKVRKELKNDFDKPIQFTMTDGELSSQICSEQNDNDFALNIKRGLVSMFQYTDSNHEIDVYGLCPTETTVSDNGNSITKIRNLNLCDYRENIIAFYASGVVNENSGIKSRPILNGHYNKVQKLLNGIYNQIELVETYNTPHELKGKPIVAVKIETTLKLGQIQNGFQSPQIAKKNSKSIIFHHPKNAVIKNLPALKKVFDETVNLVNGYAKADSAQHFSELIRLMRNADVDTLLELSAVRSELEKKVYFDALVRASTPASVKAIVKQFGKWSEKEKKIALMSLNLVTSIDLESLNSIANLITPNADREAYLSIGTLVNTYCKENSCNNGEVNEITQKFAVALRNCQAQTKTEENFIVSVLKGIRNAQHIADSITDQLIECASSKLSARIRVAALQAFSASSCNKKLENEALNILGNRNEDSEIRIEAYLAAVKCPNGDTANSIAEILNSETVNQVGGFITSHLKAVRDSTDFTKSDMKHFLGNIRITKKFPIDPRRFSFNSEFSYAVDSLGLGAAADYSLIYSQNGFLPRSARLNLTTEAFGTSFNTIEFSMRQENLENVLEHFFGPKGFFSQKPEVILNEMNRYIATNQIGRSKRDVKADVQNLAKEYKTYGGHNLNKDINFDLSMKIFGSELAFLSLGEHIPSNSDELSKLLNKVFLNLKAGMKKFEKKFEYHTLLQDIELVYPTACGLPLEIAVKASATGKFDFAIEFDVDKFVENYKNGKYRLKVVPNQDISIETYLRLDAGVLSTGLRRSSSLHSADGGDVTLELINDVKGGFNLDLKLPRQNVELIEFKHNIDFYISEQDKELKVLPFKQNKKRKTYQPVCFDQLQMFGLTVCYTANLPTEGDLIGTAAADPNSNHINRLPMLLNSPIQMSLILHTEKHIQLQGRYKTNAEYQNWQLTYDTPGSNDPHKTDLELKLGVEPKLFARIEFMNPQKHLAGEAGIINNPQEIVAYCQFEIDQDKNIQKIGFAKNGNEYRPIIQMQHGNQVRNDIAGYKADGKVTVERKGSEGPNKIEKYNFDNFRIITPENKETIFNGWIEYYQMKGFNSELDVKSSSNKMYKIESHFKRDNLAEISAGLFVTEDNNIDSKIGGSLSLQHSKENLKNEIQIQTGKHHLKMTTDLENLDTVMIKNPIQSEQSNDEEVHTKPFKFSNDLDIKNLKENQQVLHSKLIGLISKKQVEINFDANRLDKTVGLHLKLLRNQHANGDLNLDLKTKLNRHFVDLKMKIDVKQGKYLLENVLVTSFGTQGNLKGEVNQYISHQNALIDLNGSFKLNANDKENSFILKINDVQDKLESEFKLKRDNVELISYDGNMQTANDKQNGNIKLTIKDNLNLNGKYNLNKNGRGDFTGTLHIKKAGKPIKITSKFMYALPVFNMDTLIQWDDKKIEYKTENEYIKLEKLLTKNLLQIGTEKFQFDANVITKPSSSVGIIDSSEQNGDFLLVLPTERKFSGKFLRKLDVVKKNGEMQFEVNDVQPDGKTRSVKYDSKLSNFDRSKMYYNTDNHLTYTSFDNKNLQAKFSAKHLPKSKDSVRLFIMDLEVTGNLLPESLIKLAVNVDEYSRDHASYNFESKYGDKLETNLKGNYALTFNENKNHRSKYDIQFNLNAPNTEFKTINLKSNAVLKCEEGQTERESDADVNRMHDLAFNLNYQVGEKIVGDYAVQIKGTKKQGQYKINTKCPKHGVNNINGSWNREIKINDHTRAMNGKLNYLTNFEFEQYGSGNSKTEIEFTEDDHLQFHYTLTTTYEKLKNLDLMMQLKRSPNDNTIKNLIQMDLNNEKYELNNVIYTGAIKSGLDLTVKTPTKQSKLFALVEKLQDHHIKAQIQINNIVELDLNGMLELKLKFPDDSFILFELNSPKLKLNDIKGELKLTQKSLNINVKSADQNILSTQTQYNVKNEQNKIIIEGRGDVMYKTAKNSASFKLIRQLYDFGSNKNNEIGYEYTFNGELGRNNVVSTLKVTNKNFIVKLTGCEESKQCTNFEIQSVLTTVPSKVPTESNNLTHELMVLIDLRALGYPHEFELQSKCSKTGFKINHEIEATITSVNNIKYKLLVFLKPEANSIQLVLPKRILAIETQNKMPENGIFGQYQHSATFYFDKKNKPQEKATISMSADLQAIKQNEQLNGNFEIKLENPYLERPLRVSGIAKADRSTRTAAAKIEFDIFKADDQKVIGEVKAVSSSDLTTITSDKQFEYSAESRFYSTGLDFSYKAKALAKLNLAQGSEPELHLETSAESAATDMKFVSKIYGKKDIFDVQLIAFNQQLYFMKVQIDTNKYVLKTDSTYQVIGSKPIKFITELSPTKVKLVVKRDGLGMIIAELIPNKEVRLQINKGADNKQVYNAKLSLDPVSFLGTQYDVNHDEIKSMKNLIEEELQRDFGLAKDKLNDKFKKSMSAVNERLKRAKDNLPDFSKVVNRYQSNVNTILKELEDDPILKKLFVEFRQLFEKCMALVQEVAAKSREFSKKIETAFTEFYTKQEKLFNETISPAIKDLLKKCSEILNEFTSELWKVIRQVIERGVKSWKSFENDIKELSKPILEIIKPFGDSINELNELLLKEMKEFVNDLKEHVNKLPNIFKELCNKLNEHIMKLYNADEVLIILRDIFQQLETYTTSPEIKEFLTKLYNYMEAKLLNKNQINDIKELEAIYASLIRAINSLVVQLTGNDANNNSNSYYNKLFNLHRSIIQPITLSYETLIKLPSILTFKLSSLNYLHNERFSDLFITDLPSQLINFGLLDLVPPYQLYGHIADGQHIITFDGRYLTIPGNCKYVLAQDSVDNNFTVIANLNNGKMKSIELIDKNQNHIELDTTKQVKLNGKLIDYPLHSADMGIHIWHRYYTISILSTYGCVIKCSLDLRVCHVNVNGFYTSKMRGLLGNGNSEQYDDLIKPNGEISNNNLDLTEFGKAYALTASCPAVPLKQVNQQQSQPICSELFDINSSLFFGHLFVNNKAYKEACNAATTLSPQQEEAACNIALAYASAVHLLNNYLPISVPKRCTKCENNKYSVGDEFNVKIPNDKADVTLLLDTTNLDKNPEILNELIQPIINGLKQQLKQRNFNDVRLNVIGFNNKQLYPNLLSNKGKMNFEGKLQEQSFSGPLYDDFTNLLNNAGGGSSNSGINKLTDILDKLREYHTPIATELKAIELALDYPYRPEAAKSILYVRDHESKLKILNFVGTPLLNYLFKTKGVSVNYLGPVQDLTIDGKVSDKVVGFNKRAIAFLNGLGKRQKLDYESDSLIDTLVEDESWIFSLSNYKQLKTPENKKAFAQQVTQTLADQLLKTEITSNCVCTIKYGLHGESKCTRTSYEFIPTKKNTPQKQG